jgi:hypothetical protein
VPSAPFRFDRTWRFDATVDELWDAFADTSTYPAIWPWLRDFSSGPLEPGVGADFRVRPPLPYSLHFAVMLDEVVRPERVVASVAGDVRGPASLVLSPTADGGSLARVTWSLELVRPTLRRVEPLARRPMIWGHDLVVAIGVRQFRRRALSPS